MKVKISAEENPEKLAENLERRFGNAEKSGDEISIELEDPSLLTRVPGISSFEVSGEKREGLGGRPVQEQAYARLESRKDAVRALLATIEGYNLLIFETDREWDLRQLRRYNPSIKHLKFSEPKDELGIEKSLNKEEGLEKIEIEIDDKEVDPVYREMLT